MRSLLPSTTVSVAVAALLAAALLAAGAAHADAVVLGKPTGDAALDAALDATVRSALDGRAKLVDRARTVELFEKSRSFGLPCDTIDESCARAFAQLVGADEALLFVVDRVGAPPSAAPTGRPALVLRAARLDVTGTRPPQKAGGRIAAAAANAGAAVDDAVVAAIARALWGEPVPAGVQLLMPVQVTLEPAAAAVLVDQSPLTLEGGIGWVPRGQRAFEANLGGARASATLDVPGDGTMRAIMLTVAVAAPVIATGPAVAPAPAPAAPPPGNDGSFLPTAAVVGGAVVGIAGSGVLIAAEIALGSPMSPGDRNVLRGVGGVGIALIVAGGGAAAGGAWAMLSEP